VLLFSNKIKLTEKKKTIKEGGRGGEGRGGWKGDLNSLFCSHLVHS